LVISESGRAVLALSEAARRFPPAPL